MCVDCESKQHASTLRVEVIDSWHKDWPIVLKSIDDAGRRGALRMDRDGWLSARQCVLVAFSNNEVAGHLVFRIEPVRRRGVEAHLEYAAARPGFNDGEVRRLLVEAASRHARSLRCDRLVNFA